MSASLSTQFLLALSKLKGIGSATLKKIMATPNFALIDVNELAASYPVLRKAVSESGAWEKAQEWASMQLDEASRVGAQIFSIVDPQFPPRLALTKDSPVLIFVIGDIRPLQDRTVAVIGTRKPTEHGEEIVGRVVKFLVGEGCSIVSGLALGCDGLAHKAALQHGGHTVAVLAHGLQMISPGSHRRLANDILAGGGAWLSEYPFGVTVQNQQYVKRDRTQAGLSQGVVMIQSDIKGGSLYASRATLDYGRWLAVPYPTRADREHGAPKIQANLLLSQGSERERCILLECNVRSLADVVILEGKQDYSEIRRRLDLSSGFSPESAGEKFLDLNRNSVRDQQAIREPLRTSLPQLELGGDLPPPATAPEFEIQGSEIDREPLRTSLPQLELGEDLPPPATAPEFEIPGSEIDREIDRICADLRDKVGRGDAVPSEAVLPLIAVAFRGEISSALSNLSSVQGFLRRYALINIYQKAAEFYQQAGKPFVRRLKHSVSAYARATRAIDGVAERRRLAAAFAPLRSLRRRLMECDSYDKRIIAALDDSLTLDEERIKEFASAADAIALRAMGEKPVEIVDGKSQSPQ